MGGGTWTTSSFASYSTSKGRSIDLDSGILCATSATANSQSMYTQATLHEKLNPFKVKRECLDTEEHPNTIPVILAVDVTGSMGSAAVEVAKNINAVMTKLYKEITDIEFLIMGIGDLAYDKFPIQISQFESDIRIAEQLDNVYFEYGGGGNSYESYTAAWYMGSRHTSLDSVTNRGTRGILITLGDEEINPYLPKDRLSSVTGDDLQADVETSSLYEEVSEKFDVYHIDVNHHGFHDDEIDRSWKRYLDEDHYKSVKLNEVTNTIVEMILNSVNQTRGNSSCESTNTSIQTNENGEIVW